MKAATAWRARKGPDGRHRVCRFAVASAIAPADLFDSAPFADCHIKRVETVTTERMLSIITTRKRIVKETLMDALSQCRLSLEGVHTSDNVAFEECKRAIRDTKNKNPAAHTIFEPATYHYDGARVSKFKIRSAAQLARQYWKEQHKPKQERQARYTTFILQYAPHSLGDAMFGHPSFRRLQITSQRTSSGTTTHIVLQIKRTKATVLECIDAFNEQNPTAQVELKACLLPKTPEFDAAMRLLLRPQAPP